jgi:hypothetical protein
MGGKSILNLGIGSGSQGVVNKAYVDNYFDQLVAQIQWLSGITASDT